MLIGHLSFLNLSQSFPSCRNSSFKMHESEIPECSSSGWHWPCSLCCRSLLPNSVRDHHPSILIAPSRSVGDKGPGGPAKSLQGIEISFKKKIWILIFIKAEILSKTKTQKWNCLSVCLHLLSLPKEWFCNHQLLATLSFRDFNSGWGP